MAAEKIFLIILVSILGLQSCQKEMSAQVLDNWTVQKPILETPESKSPLVGSSAISAHAFSVEARFRFPSLEDDLTRGKRFQITAQTICYANRDHRPQQLHWSRNYFNTSRLPIRELLPIEELSRLEWDEIRTSPSDSSHLPSASVACDFLFVAINDSGTERTSVVRNLLITEFFHIENWMQNEMAKAMAEQPFLRPPALLQIVDMSSYAPEQNEVIRLFCDHFRNERTLGITNSPSTDDGTAAVAHSMSEHVRQLINGPNLPSSDVSSTTDPRTIYTRQKCRLMIVRSQPNGEIVQRLTPSFSLQFPPPAIQIASSIDLPNLDIKTANLKSFVQIHFYNPQPRPAAFRIKGLQQDIKMRPIFGPSQDSSYAMGHDGFFPAKLTIETKGANRVTQQGSAAIVEIGAGQSVDLIARVHTGAWCEGIVRPMTANSFDVFQMLGYSLLLSEPVDVERLLNWDGTSTDISSAEPVFLFRNLQHATDLKVWLPSERGEARGLSAAPPLRFFGVPKACEW